MTLLGFVPLLLSAVVWLLFWRVNRNRRWFSFGEVIFWDINILIIIQLIWLRWF